MLPVSWAEKMLTTSSRSFQRGTMSLCRLNKVWARKNSTHSKIGHWEKIHNFCPILMKLSENDHLMRQSFSPSFMRIEQKLWIFYQRPIFEHVLFFLAQTLAEKLQSVKLLGLFHCPGLEPGPPWCGSTLAEWQNFFSNLQLWQLLTLQSFVLQRPTVSLWKCLSHIENIL